MHTLVRWVVTGLREEFTKDHGFLENSGYIFLFNIANPAKLLFALTLSTDSFMGFTC